MSLSFMIVPQLRHLHYQHRHLNDWIYLRPKYVLRFYMNNDD